MSASVGRFGYALGMPDECYRCSYYLRGIANDQACPECGLLAERSRRVTDELHNTRPRWLRRLAWGVWLILLALLTACAWPFVVGVVDYRFTLHLMTRSLTWGRALASMLPLLGFYAAAAMLLPGVFLLTAPERYELADRADFRRRVLMRVLAAIPLTAMLLLYIAEWNQYRIWSAAHWGAVRRLWLVGMLLLTVGSAPLAVLLFYQLRSLAKRARSAHLAEHCAIVGIGASVALLYAAAAVLVHDLGSRGHLGSLWLDRSRIWLMILLALSVAVGLFTLWSLYLMVRFAIAFHRAARQLRKKWNRDDRALVEI